MEGIGALGALVELGPLGIALTFILMLIRGDLRTKQNVESCEAALTRANAQVDALLAAQAKHILATNDALLATNEALTMVAEKVNAKTI